MHLLRSLFIVAGNFTFAEPASQSCDRHLPLAVLMTTMSGPHKVPTTSHRVGTLVQLRGNSAAHRSQRSSASANPAIWHLVLDPLGAGSILLSGKEMALRPSPPLRTGRESFPSSGSSRYKLRVSGAGFHDGFLRVSGRRTPNFLKNARSSK